MGLRRKPHQRRRPHATYDERNRLTNDGQSTYTYSPRATKTTGATTEDLDFDALSADTNVMTRNS